MRVSKEHEVSTVRFWRLGRDVGGGGGDGGLGQLSELLAEAGVLPLEVGLAMVLQVAGYYEEEGVTLVLARCQSS